MYPEQSPLGSRMCSWLYTISGRQEFRLVIITLYTTCLSSYQNWTVLLNKVCWAKTAGIVESCPVLSLQWPLCMCYDKGVGKRGLPLLCFPALQGTSSLIKSSENTYDFSYCNQCCEREKLQCVAQVEDLATYNSTASSTGVWYCMCIRTELINLPMCSVANELVAHNDSRICI